MATIDVRDNVCSVIDCIRFGDHDVLEHSGTGITIIKDELNGTYAHVLDKDIPHLIKALQKAQELWGDE